MPRMKKQVLFVIDSLGCGGAEKSLVSLLPLLDSSRMDIDLCLAAHGGLNECLVPPYVHIVDLFPKGFVAKAANLVYSAALLLTRVIGKKRHFAEIQWKSTSWAYKRPDKHYDVAIAYQQGIPTFFVAKKVRASRKIAWINTDLEAAGYNRCMCSHYYKLYNNVVAVSEMLYKRIADAGFVDSTLMLTVYDILNVSLIRRLVSDAPPPAALPDGFIRIATVGRMVALKNYALAVHAAAILKKRGLHFLWHFVGDGNERDHVKQLISEYGVDDCVRLEGMLANPYPFFAAADIYVQTSKFEGFGLTLTEARLLGRPVVSTDFSVARDQIHDGINGLLAEMTPESVAEKILLLATDSGLRERISAAAAAEQNRTAETESRKVNELICRP